MKENLNSIYISEKLQEKLSRIPEYPLTTVVSPAGYGKTTALRAFREGLPPGCVVLCQSVLVDSVQEFWFDFTEMIGEATSPELAAALCKIGLPADGATQNEFLRLFRAAAVLDSGPVYVLIDDCHLIDDPSFYNFILFAGRNLPEQIHMILLSRTPVLWPWDKLLFSGKVNEINEQDLSFSQEDIQRYFAQCGYPIRPKDAARLEEVSEGWAAVLYLNLVSYADTGTFVDAGDIHSMMNTILYDPLPASERELLTAVSILPMFTSEQAAMVSGREDAPELLERMSKNNAFIKHSGGTYRLHHLLQENLRRAFGTMSRDYQRQCLSRAGCWYLQNRDAVAAARLFYGSGEYELLMVAVEQDQGAALSARNQEELHLWFRDCPAEILRAHPVAMLIYARRLFTFNLRGECVEVLEKLQKDLEQDGKMTRQQKNNLLGEVEIVQSFLDYNDIALMSIHHRRACELMDRPTTALAPTAVWGQGSPSVLACYHRIRGALDQEVDLMKRSMPYWYRLNPNQGSGAEYIFEGEMYFLRGQLTDADISLNKALYHGTRDHQLMIVFAAHFLRLRIQTFRGDFSEVSPTLQMLRGLATEQQEYMLLHTADLCEVWLYMLYGQNPGVLSSWITEGQLDGSRLLFPAMPVLHMVYGQVLLAQKKDTALIAREADERALYRLYPNLLCEIYLDIQLAAAYGRLDKTAEASEHLQQALENAVPDRLWMPFVENCDLIETQLRELSGGVFAQAVEHIHTLIGQYRQGKRVVLSGQFGKAATDDLTERERSIARLAAAGCTNKEIAAQLFLSENTIKASMRVIFSKLSLTDVANKRKMLRTLFE